MYVTDFVSGYVEFDRVEAVGSGLDFGPVADGCDEVVDSRAEFG